MLFAPNLVLFLKYARNVQFYNQIWRSTGIIHFCSLNHLRANSDFKQTSDTISYISSKYQRIFQTYSVWTICQVFKKVLKDLAHWKSLCFSWTVRTNVIKMNISVRFNYLSQGLLIMISLSFLTSW